MKLRVCDGQHERTGLASIELIEEAFSRVPISDGYEVALADGERWIGAIAVLAEPGGEAEFLLSGVTGKAAPPSGRVTPAEALQRFREFIVRRAMLLWLPIGLSACTGLVAGPESSNVTPLAASRDSAYVRARRALQAESFTLDLVDSSGGALTGTRYPSRDAQLGSAAACRMTLALRVRGDAQQAEVTSRSRWLAPAVMSDKAPKVCEQTRTEVLERIALVLAPPPQ